jgi:peptidoglycan-associated lipoprotein
LTAFLAIGLIACSTSQQATKSNSALTPTGPAQKAQGSQTSQGVTGLQDQQKKTNVTSTTPSKSPEIPTAVLKDIYFDFDRYMLSQESMETLKQNSVWFKANPTGRLIIEGNCDERGTVEYNLALGQKRADAAKNFLMNLGVDAKKLDTISYGKEKPADSAHTEGAWTKNRRDHFVPTK